MHRGLTIFSRACVAFILIGLVELVGASGLLRYQLAAQELSYPTSSPSHIEPYGPQCTEAGLFRQSPETLDPLLMSFDEPAGMCTEESPGLLDKLAYFLRQHGHHYPQLASASKLSLDTGLPADAVLGLRLRIHSSQEFGESTGLDTATSRSSPSPETADQNLSVRLQPYVTRDFLEATQPLEELDGQYTISPLDPTERIYGFGILSNYKVSSWLHLNSSYRFNVHSTGSRRSSSSFQQGGDTSHSFFFGITVPFQAPSEEE